MVVLGKGKYKVKFFIIISFLKVYISKFKKKQKKKKKKKKSRKSGLNYEVYLIR